MQSLLDSLCQCLGSSPLGPDGDGMDVTNGDTSGRGDGILEDTNSGSPSPASRRTQRLSLKDKKWDALFDSVPVGANGTKVVSPDARKTYGSSQDNLGCGASSSPVSVCGPQMAFDTANDVAKVKQAANPSRYRTSSPGSVTKNGHKRKRPTSRDDIFRQRKTCTPGRQIGCGVVSPEDQPFPNPLSKFLSNHTKSFANALCFATPVRDEEDEDELTLEEKPDDASEAATLNTCEETITSVLFMDKRVANMVENRPPMPLFNQYKLDHNEPEGLRRIVDSDAHSSALMLNNWSRVQPLNVPQVSSSTSSGIIQHERTTSSSTRALSNVDHRAEEPNDLPRMKSTSSSQSSSSRRSIVSQNANVNVNEFVDEYKTGF